MVHIKKIFLKMNAPTRNKYVQRENQGSATRDLVQGIEIIKC